MSGRAGLDAGRVVDLLLAVVLLPLAAPVILLGACCGRLRRLPRVGRLGRPFSELGIAGPCSRWPALLNVLAGQMAFVGPRPAELGELPEDHARFGVRPGLVSLWSLRQRANVAYGTELEVDAEYVRRRGPLRDLGILARSLLAGYGGRATETSRHVEILGIPIDNLTMAQSVARIVAVAVAAERARQVCFVNADCGNIACRDRDYHRLLCEADLVLADGIGFRLAGRMLGREIRENVNGTDMLPLLLDALEPTDLGLFLLGARPGVAEAVAESIARSHPGVRISGTQHGYFEEDEAPAVARRIRESGARVLLVALGAPHQERWIARHAEACGVGVAIGVGGLFDFASGQMRRAPQWLRELGLEWTYRLWMEPRRMWRRYLVGNGLFLGRVLLQRLGRDYGGGER